MNKIQRSEKALFLNSIFTIISSIIVVLYLTWFFVFLFSLKINNLENELTSILTSPSFLVITNAIVLLVLMNWIYVIYTSIILVRHYKTKREKLLLLFGIFSIIFFFGFIYFYKAIKNHDHYYEQRWIVT